MNATGATQKQKLNVYTVMLIASGIFLIFGSVCLYMALSQFGDYPYWKTNQATIQLRAN
ncbi:MAG: hypothetical protein KDA83_02625 [Planctomycetales bacterium]|nr:hypothetical protein [Planctomycetales bacterium]